MSRVDLNRNREALLKAHKEISDPKNKDDWVVFGYEGNTPVIKVVERGDGGVEEMVDELNSGKVMYAYLRVTDPNTNLPKYVFINWQGEGVPEQKKGSCASHVRDVKDFFRGAHVTINARTEEDVEEEVILDKVSKSSGSNYSFHKEKSTDVPDEVGPVGSVYKKTRPHAEIKTNVRDKFWEKQQQEEKERQEGEAKRLQEEGKRLDQERRKREEQEGVARDQREQERIKKIREIKNAEKLANAPAKHDKEQWAEDEDEESQEQTQREALRDEEERAKRSETLRKERQAEAASLVSQRSKNTRAMFEPNAASQFDQPGGDKPNRGPPPARKLKHSFLPETDNSASRPRKQPIQLPKGDPESERPTASVRTQPPPREPSPEPVRQPSPEPVRQPSPEPVREPSPEPVREPSPEPVRSPAQPTSPAAIPQARNLMRDGLPPRQDSDEEQEDDQDWGEEDAPRSPVLAVCPPATMEEQQYAHNQPQEEEDQIYENYEEATSPVEEQPSPEATGVSVRALYDYQAEDESEITFDPGDIITDVNKIDEGWWTGTGPDGRHGMFPANYVEEM